MPSNWWAIDTNFPSFTGEETPTQQIQALHDYLYQLRQSLQYSMQNLSAENFNETALRNLTDAQKNEMEKLLADVRTELNRLSGSVGSFSSRLSTAEKEITTLKKKDTDIRDLEEWTGAAEQQLQELQTKLEGLEEREQKLIDIVQIGEDGNITIGADGKELHLAGTIYINGVLYEQGGTE